MVSSPAGCGNYKQLQSVIEKEAQAMTGNGENDAISTFELVRIAP